MSSLPPAPLSNSLYNVLMTNTTDQPTTFGGEEISTIFVVGFPDDMQEREFQNMFTFSPGFEAATLKVPSKDQDEDLPQVSANSTNSSNNNNNNNNNNARKQIVSSVSFIRIGFSLIYFCTPFLSFRPSFYGLIDWIRQVSDATRSS